MLHRIDKGRRIRTTQKENTGIKHNILARFLVLTAHD